jgi:hypothetical protein
VPFLESAHRYTDTSCDINWHSSMTSIFYLLRKREQSTTPDLVTWGGGDQTSLSIPFSLRDYHTTLSGGSQYMQWRRMLIVFNQKECEFAPILLRDETYHQGRYIMKKYESMFCHTCHASLFRWDLPDFHTYFCTLHTFCDSQFSSRLETKQTFQNFLVTIQALVDKFQGPMCWC